MSEQGRIKTAGNWSPAEANVYFLASSPATNELKVQAELYDWLLIAVNEINNKNDEEIVQRAIRRGAHVFLDSGVFALTNDHARAHDVSMDEALGLPPDEIDGFDKLFELYVRLMREFGDHAWGYIEIDQGGKENKRKTRKRLQDMGLRPIPVYHPLNDGWDYFDELASTHDRMCFGNVVQADIPTRKRLVATAWQRRRRYPDVWIHLLGLTPYEICCALPINSCDSSTWKSGVRWMTMPTRSMLKAWSTVEEHFFRYDTEHEDKTAAKALQVSAMQCRTDMMNWRAIVAEVEEVLQCDHRQPL